MNRRPRDITYSRLHWILLGIITAILLGGWLAGKHYNIPRDIGFRAVILVLLSFNAIWWSIADRRWARHIRSPHASGIIRGLTGLLTLALNAPLLYMLMTAGIPTYLEKGPLWYASAVTLWQLGLAILMPLIALARLALIGSIRSAYGLRHYLSPSAASGVSDDPPDCTTNSPIKNQQYPDRRSFLQTTFQTALASVPVATLGGLVAASRIQQSHLAIHRHALAAPWLPSRLRGLTITHLSDLHLGRLYRPCMLPTLIDQANRLDGDIVVITGDIVDMSNEMLPAALDAFGLLTHRHGLFLSIGNHDEIDNRDEFVSLVRTKFPLLINQRQTLEIGGERLTIGGLAFARREKPGQRHSGPVADLRETLQGYDANRDGPMIALSHHPHTFDLLADHGIPLTLSGHTHGGQIMLTPPPKRPDIGIGSLLFRYLRGFYRRNGATLFVHSGIGNWFPLRINAEAEVVQIQLIA